MRGRGTTSVRQNVGAMATRLHYQSPSPLLLSSSSLLLSFSSPSFLSLLPSHLTGAGEGVLFWTMSVCEKVGGGGVGAFSTTSVWTAVSDIVWREKGPIRKQHSEFRMRREKGPIIKQHSERERVFTESNKENAEEKDKER